MRASAKQWTVVMALSLMLTGVTTLAGQSLDTGQLQTKEDSTQLEGTNQSTPAKPVARLMLGSDTSTPLAQQELLGARRALAMGDVPTAKQHLAKAQAMDSPASVKATIAAVESMVERHKELAKMQTAGDSSYNQKAATFLLQQAEGLLQMGDWQTAETLAKTAKQFEARYDSNLTPQSILDQVAAARQEVVPTAASRDQALRLMSQLKLSMDQNQLAEAQELMTKLKSMDLSDSLFTADDDRPWQLELELQAKLRDQASAAAADPLAGMVTTADFQPESDDSKVVQASVDTTPAVEYDQTQDAIELYLRGVQAMNSGNRSVAQELFNKAWAKKDSLDGAVREALAQKMTLLKNTVPATTVSSRNILQEETISTPATPDMDTQGQLILQKMRQHVIRQRAAADKLVEDQKPHNAVNVLQQLRAEVEQSDVEPGAKAGLLTMVDRELERLNQYIDEHSVEIATAEANTARMEEVLQDRETRYANEQKIQLLVEEFNKLKHEQRFAEARVIARQASELSPNEPAVIAMITEAKFMETTYLQEQMKLMKEERQLAEWNDTDLRAATPMDPNMPYEHGPQREWAELTADRARWLEEQNMGDPTEYRIRQVLRNHKVQTNFVGTPLEQAIGTLAMQAGVNVTFDARGMAAEGTDISVPVNLTLNEPISLESALHLMLSNYKLIYVIENEVIKITTPTANPAKFESRMIYVGDLVHPIPNFQGINPISIMSAGGVVTTGGLGAGGQLASPGQMVGPLAATSTSGSNYANPTLLAQQLAPAVDPSMAQQYGMAGTTTPTVDPTTGMGGQVQADFTSLINLIQSTVEPLSWEDNGGPAGATITEFRNTNSLVIRNTQEVHNQIQTLLKRLRELQDVQIVIETRFISLSDSFFERIGVDFDFEIDDNSGFNSNTLGTLDDGGPSVTVGRLGEGTLTLPADLDIPFSQDSFSEAIPQFGGFGSAANFGFAILSDIEVFFLIQAANGDQRSNIMTAPKITLFNGQFGSVSDVVTRSFVTSVTPVVGSFAAAHAPVISTLAEGTMMSVQAVVSHDRRFVRLTLVPTFTKLNDVQEFTFTGSTTTDTGSNIFDPTDGSLLGSNNQTTTREGVTVQQPVFAITQVSATVAVPDGGTVLLGGVKRLSEARVERGIPFLSNLPYVNRLFKNVGIGRDTSSLMLMVTPRIIIKEEEEARQVGLAP